MLRSAYIAESCGQSTSHSRILSCYSPWVPREMGNNGSSAHDQWKRTFQDKFYGLHSYKI